VTPTVPSFGKKQSEEHSFVISTRTTTKKQRRGNGFFFCLLVESSCHKKEGAQKQRGRLVARDADRSFDVPICCKKTKKRGQGKLAYANCLIDWRDDQSNQQQKKEAARRGVAGTPTVPSFGKKQRRVHLSFGLEGQRNKNKGEATPMVSSFVCSSNLLVHQKERSTEAEGEPGRSGCQSFLWCDNLSQISKKKARENGQTQVVRSVGITIDRRIHYF